MLNFVRDNPTYNVNFGRTNTSADLPNLGDIRFNGRAESAPYITSGFKPYATKDGANYLNNLKYGSKFQSSAASGGGSGLNNLLQSSFDDLLQRGQKQLELKNRLKEIEALKRSANNQYGYKIGKDSELERLKSALESGRSAEDFNEQKYLDNLKYGHEDTLASNKYGYDSNLEKLKNALDTNLSGVKAGYDMELQKQKDNSMALRNRLSSGYAINEQNNKAANSLEELKYKSLIDNLTNRQKYNNDYNLENLKFGNKLSIDNNNASNTLATDNNKFNNDIKLNSNEYSLKKDLDEFETENKIKIEKIKQAFKQTGDILTAKVNAKKIGYDIDENGNITPDPNYVTKETREQDKQVIKDYNDYIKDEDNDIQSTMDFNKRTTENYFEWMGYDSGFTDVSYKGLFGTEGGGDGALTGGTTRKVMDTILNKFRNGYDVKIQNGKVKFVKLPPNSRGAALWKQAELNNDLGYLQSKFEPVFNQIFEKDGMNNIVFRKKFLYKNKKVNEKMRKKDNPTNLYGKFGQSANWFGRQNFALQEMEEHKLIDNDNSLTPAEKDAKHQQVRNFYIAQQIKN